MDRRRSVVPALFVLAALLFTSTLRADHGHDNDDDDEDEEGHAQTLTVKVQGPIDAVDLAATPPTVTVLGLSIDISGVGNTSGDCGCGGGVVFLAIGQNVEITLKSSTAPFVATKLTPKTGYDERVAITAPIESVDATAKTITLLGLTIDATSATIESTGSSSSTKTLTFADLKVGQTVEAILDQAQLPALVALKITVQQTGNCVDINVGDEDGQTIDVDITVSIKITVTGPDGKTTTITKDIHIHYTVKGSVTLAGLPDGKAKVSLTRADGQKASKKLNVKGNRIHKIKAKFKKAKKK